MIPGIEFCKGLRGSEHGYDVASEVGAMPVEMVQDDVDGLALVPNGYLFGKFLPQRPCEALNRRLNIVELLDSFLLSIVQAKDATQAIEQVGARLLSA